MALPTPIARTDKDIICFDSALAELTYCTRVTGVENEHGLTPQNWKELACLAAEGQSWQLHNRIAQILGSAEHADNSSTLSGRVAYLHHKYPSLDLVVQLESSNDIDGDVSIWRMGNAVHVAWRGTESLEDAFTDLKFRKVPFTTSQAELQSGVREHETNVRVHRGFLHQYLATNSVNTDGSMRNLDDPATRRIGSDRSAEQLNERVIARVKAMVASILEEHKSVEVHICGHSLGGALAHLCLFEIALCDWCKPHKLFLVTCGSPLTGNAAFANAINELEVAGRLRTFRVQNGMDIVTSIPPRSFDYKHAGRHVWIKDGTVQAATNLGNSPFWARSALWTCLCTGGLGVIVGSYSVPDHMMGSYLIGMASSFWDPNAFGVTGSSSSGSSARTPLRVLKREKEVHALVLQHQEAGERRLNELAAKVDKMDAQLRELRNNLDGVAV